MVVFDQQSDITGIRGSILETFAYVSSNPTDVLDGQTSRFILDVIRDSSEYIWMFGESDGSDIDASLGSGITYWRLGNGIDSGSLTVNEYVGEDRGYSLMSDSDSFDIDFFIAPPYMNQPEVLSGVTVSATEAWITTVNHLVGIVENTADSDTGGGDIISGRGDSMVVTATPNTPVSYTHLTLPTTPYV